MNNKFKMILSILLSITLFILTIINIFFSNSLGIIFKLIFGSLGITYYILLSIYFGKNKKSNTLKRLSTCFQYAFMDLFIIYLILLLKSSLKWILLGIIITISIITIIFQAINKFKIIIKLLNILRLFILLYLAYIISNNLMQYTLITTGTILFYRISYLLYEEKYQITYFIYFIIYIFIGIFLLYN